MIEPSCEVCDKPVPDDPDGWEKTPDGGDWDHGWMWFCPACQKGDDDD